MTSKLLLPSKPSVLYASMLSITLTMGLTACGGSDSSDAPADNKSPTTETTDTTATKTENTTSPTQNSLAATDTTNKAASSSDSTLDSDKRTSITTNTQPQKSNTTLATNTNTVNSTVVNSRSDNAQSYLIGAGKADITGAAAETGMFGYAASQKVEGINDRLYSHAFIIDDNKNRVVYVSADLGAMFTSVKLEVMKRLKPYYGDLYNDDNVMLTATHTHVGSGGHSHQQLYQIASFDDTPTGYNSQNFNAIVDGIVASIQRAHKNLAPGTLSLAEGKLKGATINRSIPAYNKNPDSINYDSNVNETMTQLRLNAKDGTPLGLINWFPVHPTSFSNQFMHLSADNKGYAQLGAEKIWSKNPNKPFVAAFPNADGADVIAAGGNANSKPGYEGSDDEWENVRRDGSLQLNKAISLWNKGQPVYGPVDVRARWIDLNGYQVNAKFTNGAGPKTLCRPARGYSFAAGGENGPSGVPGVYEGMTRKSLRLDDGVNKVDQTLLGMVTRGVFGIISTPSQDDCQEEKAVLLPTGAWGMVNTQQPVQLIRIGNLAIVAIPGEPTTMVGRRMRAAVLEQLKGSGVDTVIINGLANNYSGYFTTREEYAAQHYEGASTEFGPYQTNAYIQEYTLLAQALRSGSDVYDTTMPPDRSGQSFAERPGVIFDDKPPQQKWGQELVKPQAKYKRGETATAVFRGAHPKNNLRTGDTFLKVQRFVNGTWQDYLTDSDFDTTYTWKRDGVSYSKVTIDWRIGKGTPNGVYRLVHQGDWKNGWNHEIKPYSGNSSIFTVGS